MWSEKLVFTGQQTVIFLRLANYYFSSRFKYYFIAKLKNEMNVQESAKRALSCEPREDGSTRFFVKISF